MFPGGLMTQKNLRTWLKTHKIIASIVPVNITANAVKTLKLKDGFSALAIPNEILDKFHAKKFDVIDSGNELILVAQTATAEATNDKNKPPAKRIVSWS